MTGLLGLRFRRTTHPAASGGSVSGQKTHNGTGIAWGGSEWESILRSDIHTAISECLRGSKPEPSTIAGHVRILENEASKMLDSVEAAVVRDDFSHRHNDRMRRRERLICCAGMLCLLCPAFVFFNKIMTLFPEHHEEILQYASQQDNLYGATSRFCLTMIRTARSVSNANANSGFTLFWGCFGAMAILLVLVRHATTKHSVMSAAQRNQIAEMKVLIEEEVQNAKSIILASMLKTD